MKVSLPADISSALMDGVVLCHLANHVRPRSVSSIHVPSPAVVRHPLICLYLFLSVSLYLWLSISLSPFLSFSLSFPFFFYLPLPLSVSSVFLFLSLSIILFTFFLFLSYFLSLSLSASLFLFLSLLSIYFFTAFYSSVSFHLSLSPPRCSKSTSLLYVHLFHLILPYFILFIHLFYLSFR